LPTEWLARLAHCLEAVEGAAVGDVELWLPQQAAEATWTAAAALLSICCNDTGEAIADLWQPAAQAPLPDAAVACGRPAAGGRLSDHGPDSRGCCKIRSF